jgi:hypothetical protein
VTVRLVTPAGTVKAYEPGTVKFVGGLITAVAFATPATKNTAAKMAVPRREKRREHARKPSVITPPSG